MVSRELNFRFCRRRRYKPVPSPLLPGNDHSTESLPSSLPRSSASSPLVFSSSQGRGNGRIGMNRKRSEKSDGKKLHNENTIPATSQQSSSWRKDPYLSAQATVKKNSLLPTKTKQTDGKKQVAFGTTVNTSTRQASTARGKKNSQIPMQTSYGKTSAEKKDGQISNERTKQADSASDISFKTQNNKKHLGYIRR